MKIKILMAFFALFMFVGTAGLATAQDTTKITHRKDQSAGRDRSQFEAERRFQCY
jgi:hypothetical protein